MEEDAERIGRVEETIAINQWSVVSGYALFSSIQAMADP